MRSVACGPMMWTPSVSSVRLSAMTLAKPSYSPPMIAFAMAWNGTLPTLYSVPAALHLLLGQADRGDLGPAVGRARLADVVHLVDVGVAGDRVRRDDPLVRRGVGQPQAADDVADRVDVRLLRPHVAVDLDDPAVGLDLRSSRGRCPRCSRRGRWRRASSRRAAPRRPCPRARRRRVTPSLSALTAAASKRAFVMTVDAALREAALERLADLAVLERDDLGQVLEHRDLDADVVEHRGELDADRAGARR